MSATPTEQITKHGDREPLPDSPELNAMFRRVIGFALAGAILLLVHSALPAASRVGWPLRIVGFGLLGATVLQSVALVAELWRGRRRPPPEVISPRLAELRGNLLGWTAWGGGLGGWLHYWLIHRFGVERHSATEGLLGIALSTGGAYAGALAWRVRARRRGVPAAEIAEVRRLRG